MSPPPAAPVTATAEALDLPPIPHRKGWRAIYAKPIVQVTMISLVCFACPGLFNALSGIGGGGQVNADASNKGNIALYSCFSVTSFFSGTINNRIGSRLTLSLGALGYALYMGAFLSYNINQNSGFVIAAGAILGVCAGMLWTAQGAMTLAYATEQTKGRYMALFWCVFNLGAVMGNAIELGLSYDSTAGNLSNGVYATFLVLSAVGGIALPAMLVNPAVMVRDDHTRVIVPVHPSWKSEIIGLFKCLRMDLWVCLLFPYFLASKTRALNSMLYYGFQIFGALFVGACLDSKRFKRVTRAWGGLGLVVALCLSIWGGSYYYQKGYTRESVATMTKNDLKDKDYGGHIVLYIFMGIMDAVWQNYAYWIMGAMSNSPSHLAYIVGFYKALQSAGNVGISHLDLILTPYMTMLACSWALCMFSTLLVVPLIKFRIKEHSDDDIVVVGDVSESDEGSFRDEKSPKTQDVHPNPNILFISVLPGPDEDQRLYVLKAIAAQFKKLCAKYHFGINSLTEHEWNREFAGRNWNGGEIAPYDFLLRVMAHELAHCGHMNHGADFQKLNREILKDVFAQRKKGDLGDGFWSAGRSLVVASGKEQREEEFEAPELICGGTRTKRSWKGRRRGPQRATGSSGGSGGVRGAPVKLGTTGRQTAVPRKSGGRVNRKGAFEGEGNMLSADPEMSSFRRKPREPVKQGPLQLKRG
ncbi:Major Facilitator Superfamily protein [Pseudohyphozyma bogoriensis]|nr:Major Facilitator Superfamily protein [Pseudohyphozyma bogoriensis]